MPLAKNKNVGNNLMPDKHMPPDWSAYLFYLFCTIIAGVMGAFMRQIHRPPTHLTQRICEWVGGGICAFYGSEIVAQILFHLMKKSDLIHSDFINVNELLGLSGFLCGAIGITILDALISFIRKKTGTDK